MSTHYLAADLGAESGRLMLGTIDGGTLSLEELHRFPNTPIKGEGSLHWNIPALFCELKAGLKKAAARGLPYAGISTDSWGVDYLLFDAGGELMSPTFHYRDPRTAQGVKNAYAKTDWPTIFAETGIQYMPLNTLFQLAAESSARLQQAKLILGVGDGFNYLLCGKACIEVSMASTFQLYNPVARAWSDRLMKLLGLPRAMFPEIVPSGTRLGGLKPELAAETGLPHSVEVLATCSHDTGAAVVAVPASGENWAYLSSGTWSLMGVELPEPIINDACREFNFTNEIGHGHTVRLLKNIVGLWIVQECRREWAAQGHEHDYAELTRLASHAAPFVSLINPADARFVPPGEMPAKIAAYCRETGQPVPDNPGATIRCVLESLALLYARTLKQIEQLTRRKIERLHIVGGGSKNVLLNQLTANAVEMPVVAGPAEATAAGNVLLQAIALGHVASLAAARDIMRSSTVSAITEPSNQLAWASARGRFVRLP
ncbi:MAG: rhamnulokinase family protein [Verrucomicrobiota bacterium]